MSEKSPASFTQTVYIIMTAAIFLVVGILIATLLNNDSVSQDDLKNSVNQAVGTNVALSAPTSADLQALVDAAVSTQIAGSAPVATSSGASSALTQDELQALVDQAVGTSVALSASTSADQQPDLQALVDAAVSTQIAGSAPVATSSGASSALTQGELQAMVDQAVGTSVALSASTSADQQPELQALVDQAVGTQVAALRPTNTPIPPTPTMIPSDVAADDDAFQGPVDAPVVIVEFSDFQCGYCNRWAQQVLPKILETYPDEVKFVYRDFTIFGEDSVRAAQAAECAEESGKFWEMHNYLFNGLATEERIALDEDSLVSAAVDLGVEEDSFRECLSSQRYLEEVINDGRTAQSLGFGGTPGFIINGVVYPFGAQSFEVFDGIIRAELDAAGS